MKFIVAMLAVLLPSSVILYETALRATLNTITVNSLSDESGSGDGSCSLREAINNANSPGVDTTGTDCKVGTGTDTIDFSISDTIFLGSTLPAIANSSPGSLTIDGSGQNVTIDGWSLFPGLHREFWRHA